MPSSSTPLIAAGAVGALVGALLMARSRRPAASAGGDEDAAPSSMELLKRFVEVFGRGDREAAIAFAPGRANLIGEHTDYAEGFVFPFGINKHVYVVFRARDDTKLRVYAADLDAWGEIDLADVARARAADPAYGPQIQPEFLRYCVGPFEWMRATHAGADAGALRGFDAYLTSTVPRGGGVSSSSALTVACTIAARRCNPQLTLGKRVDGKDSLTMVACESASRRARRARRARTRIIRARRAALCTFVARSPPSPV